MHACATSVEMLTRMLGPSAASDAIHLAKKAQTLEDKWKEKVDKMFSFMASDIAESIVRGHYPYLENFAGQFEELFVEHAFDVMFEAFKTTKRMPVVTDGASKRLAYPKGPMPRSLKQLLVLWDKWRNKKQAPPRQRDIAAKVRKSYIKKAQEIVKKYENRLNTGENISKKHVADLIEKRSKVEAARARMIVETETTRYWNQARRDAYDESPDVTHYLFVAIRDMATTKWCKSRTGLVYAKGDPLLDKEQPPAHWYCRSEILPLTPQNPRHKLLIDNKSLMRRNHSPEPLPPGWNQ